MKPLWTRIDRQGIERDCDHATNAASEGRANRPKTESIPYSKIESEIIDQSNDAINEQIEAAKEIIEDKENELIALKTKIKSDSYANLPAEMATELTKYSTEFKQKIREKFHDWDIAKKGYSGFKNIHHLTREYSSKSLFMFIFSIVLIIGLLLFEISVNASLLQEAMSYNASYALAQSVAFVNVFLSFLIGMGVMRQINHYKKINRIIFSLVLLFYSMLILWINGMVGVYRTLIGAVTLKGDDPTVQQLADWNVMAAQPWANLNELNVTGWTLIIMGISFALIALFDGYFFSDTYPGYGKIGQKLKMTEKEYLKIKSSYEKKGNDKFVLTTSLSQDLQGVDRSNREVWSEMVNDFQAIFVEFENKAYSWESDINHIIQEYRQINIESRQTPPPKYFSEPYRLSDRKKSAKLSFQAQYGNTFMKDEDRDSEEEKYEKLNEDQYNNSLKKIEESYQSYNKEIERTLNEYSIY